MAVRCKSALSDPSTKNAFWATSHVNKKGTNSQYATIGKPNPIGPLTESAGINMVAESPAPIASENKSEDSLAMVERDVFESLIVKPAFVVSAVELDFVSGVRSLGFAPRFFELSCFFPTLGTPIFESTP